jgi:hypothetical protein
MTLQRPWFATIHSGQNFFTHIHHSHYRKLWLDIAPKQRPGYCYLVCNTESLMEWERYGSMGFYVIRSNWCPCDLQDVQSVAHVTVACAESVVDVHAYAWGREGRPVHRPQCVTQFLTADRVQYIDYRDQFMSVYLCCIKERLVPDFTFLQLWSAFY